MNEHFLAGFVKQAANYNFNKDEAFELLKTGGAYSPAIQKQLSKIYKGYDRSTDIVNNMLEFAKTFPNSSRGAQQFSKAMEGKPTNELANLIGWAEDYTRKNQGLLKKQMTPRQYQRAIKKPHSSRTDWDKAWKKLHPEYDTYDRQYEYLGGGGRHILDML